MQLFFELQVKEIFQASPFFVRDNCVSIMNGTDEGKQLHGDSFCSPGNSCCTVASPKTRQKQSFYVAIGNACQGNHVPCFLVRSPELCPNFESSECWAVTVGSSESHCAVSTSGKVSEYLLVEMVFNNWVSPLCSWQCLSELSASIWS